MSNLESLKQQILNAVSTNDYSIDNLKNILVPIGGYVDDSTFKQNMIDVVTIIIKDRDGNNKFTIDDLNLLGKDVIAITSLITSILLLITAIPNFKLQYNEGETEEIIFKLLAYIFLVIIPAQTGNPWTLEEKQSVINLTLLIYQLIKSSQVVQGLIAKVTEWFKSKNWCKCVSGSSAQQKQDVLEKKLPIVKLELLHAMNNVRDKSAMQLEIKELKNQLKTN